MDDKTRSLAELFQALGDPNRLGIIKLLMSEPLPLCVNALARELGISQSAVSQHLKILRHQGLVEAKKEGYYKHYTVSVENLDSVRMLREEVLGDGFAL